jgi:hypothetical protein
VSRSHGPRLPGAPAATGSDEKLVYAASPFMGNSAMESFAPIQLNPTECISSNLAANAARISSSHALHFPFASDGPPGRAYPVPARRSTARSARVSWLAFDPKARPRGVRSIGRGMVRAVRPVWLPGAISAIGMLSRQLVLASLGARRAGTATGSLSPRRRIAHERAGARRGGSVRHVDIG